MTVAAIAVLVAVAVMVDRSVTRSLRADAVEAVEARLAGHASALQLGLGQRAGLLVSLAAWVREGDESPAGSFSRFLASLHRMDPGIRALQRVEGGRITASYPAEGNEGVLGFDLLGHPDTRVSQGLLRALDQDRITLTGPVELIQGGTGMILRRSAGKPGDRSAPSAALVLDVETVMREAGIPGLVEDFDVGVVTEDGRSVTGVTDFDAPPAAVAVPLPEGEWTLLAAPRGGWDALVSPDRRPVRAALGLVLVLASLLVYGLVDRDTRLAEAVEVRTAELTRVNRALEEAAEALAAREVLLDAALTAGGVLTWWWDVREDPIWRSGSGEAAYGPGDLASPDVASTLDRVHPEDRRTLEQALEQARRTGTLGLDYRAGDEQSGYVWLRVEGRCTERDEDGPVRIVGATADVTRLKELEAELVHGGRLELIGQLAGGVAHDLNNALTVVRAELELALEDGRATTFPDAAGRAIEATQYASLLIGQLLTFARKDEVRPTTFAWDDMCSEVVAFLSRLLGRTIRLELELGAGDARVHMDRAQAMQVLTNLATNGRDAMDGSGMLTLCTRTVDDGSNHAPGAAARPSVVLEVTDRGRGIPQAARERIFEPFFTTKPRDRGTGLGLSTTHRIVRETGGGITFRTSPEGTTFVVVIPRVEAD